MLANGGEDENFDSELFGDESRPVVMVVVVLLHVQTANGENLQKLPDTKSKKNARRGECFLTPVSQHFVNTMITVSTTPTTGVGVDSASKRGDAENRISMPVEVKGDVCHASNSTTCSSRGAASLRPATSCGRALRT